MVLMMVLVFALLLTGSVATFGRRAAVDVMISKNRESQARAEALARGGIRLAKALLLEDLLEGAPGAGSLDTQRDAWALVGFSEIETDDGSSLRVRIEDAASRLNLNAVLLDSGDGPDPNAQPLIEALLEKVIDEMPIPPGEKVYDVKALAEALVDWVDEDDEEISGGRETDVYESRTPRDPGPPNRALLSVDELRRIEGYDAKLVAALHPYVTVYPYAASTGINPNTAPPHVLALLFFDDGVELTLADESLVREILEVRQEDGFVCDASLEEGCVPLSELVTNSIFPEPSYVTHVFLVEARARVGDVERTIEAVLDRREAPNVGLLSWRVR
jgi:type II secretory pathway component PulK